MVVMPTPVIVRVLFELVATPRLLLMKVVLVSPAEDVTFKFSFLFVA